METQCLRVKIKPGRTDQVVTWMKGLSLRENEVRHSLERETMVVESVFLDRQDSQDYLIFYTRAESLQEANRMMTETPTELDKEALHLIQETWSETTPLETLFDIDRIASVDRTKAKAED